MIDEFEIERIINDDMDALWNLMQDFSGITEEYFYQYFADRESGFAIEIKNTKRYKQPKCLKADFNLLPPQSFAYFKA